MAHTTLPVNGDGPAQGRGAAGGEVTQVTQVGRKPLADGEHGRAVAAEDLGYVGAGHPLSALDPLDQVQGRLFALDVVHVDAGVDRCRGQAAVAEHDLQREQIGTGLEMVVAKLWRSSLRRRPLG